MKRRYSSLAVGVSCIIGIAVYATFSKNAPETLHPEHGVHQQTAVIGGETFSLEVVDTDESQRLGLSGRESLAAGTAMLFAHNEPGERCIWMKDMRFPIDIVWLDASKTIVKIIESAAPESYPTTFCADNTWYVLEMNAGETDRLDVATGDKVVLQL